MSGKKNDWISYFFIESTIEKKLQKHETLI